MNILTFIYILFYTMALIHSMILKVMYKGTKLSMVIFENNYIIYLILYLFSIGYLIF